MTYVHFVGYDTPKTTLLLNHGPVEDKSLGAMTVRGLDRSLINDWSRRRPSSGSQKSQLAGTVWQSITNGQTRLRRWATRNHTVVNNPLNGANPARKSFRIRWCRLSFTLYLLPVPVAQVLAKAMSSSISDSTLNWCNLEQTGLKRLKVLNEVEESRKRS